MSSVWSLDTFDTWSIETFFWMNISLGCAFDWCIQIGELKQHSKFSLAGRSNIFNNCRDSLWKLSAIFGQADKIRRACMSPSEILQSRPAFHIQTRVDSRLNNFPNSRQFPRGWEKPHRRPDRFQYLRPMRFDGLLAVAFSSTRRGKFYLT